MIRRSVFLSDARAMRNCSARMTSSARLPDAPAPFDCLEPSQLLDRFLARNASGAAENLSSEVLDSFLLPLCTCAESDGVLELARDDKLDKFIDVLSEVLQAHSSSSTIHHIFFLLGRLANAGAEMTMAAVRAGLPYLSRITDLMVTDPELLKLVLWFYAYAANYDAYGRQQLLLYASVDELLKPISSFFQLDRYGDESVISGDSSKYFSLLNIAPIVILQPLGHFLSSFLANCHYDFDADAFVYARKMIFFFFAISPLFSNSEEWRRIGNDILLGINNFYSHQDFGVCFSGLFAWKQCIKLIKEYRDMVPQLLCFVGNLAATSINNDIFSDLSTPEFNNILSNILESGIYNAYADVAITIEILFAQWPPYRTIFRESNLIKVLVSNFYSVTHITVNSSINIVSITIGDAWRELFLAGLVDAMAHHLQHAVIKKTVSFTNSFIGRCFRILYQLLELARDTPLEEKVSAALATNALYECYIAAHDFPSMAVYASVSSLIELVRGRSLMQKKPYPDGL